MAINRIEKPSLETIAERVAIRVLGDLRSKRVKTADANVIKHAVEADRDCPTDGAARGLLIAMVNTNIVRKAVDNYKRQDSAQDSAKE